MGLGLSHGSFNCSYSTFKDLRVYLANKAGIEDRFNVKEDDILKIFFEHSDCDGEIESSKCNDVADKLEALLPDIPESVFPPCFHKLTQQFIEGLRSAYAANENLRFI